MFYNKVNFIGQGDNVISIYKTNEVVAIFCILYLSNLNVNIGADLAEQIWNKAFGGDQDCSSVARSLKLSNVNLGYC